MNRGKIAVRITRTCKGMSTETVMVYSTAGKKALHVQSADYTVYIDDPRTSDNYLNVENTLGAACMIAYDAIHPGPGFLNESAESARLVLQYGLIFVDPNPGVIEQVGDKGSARHCTMEAGAPAIPGGRDLLEIVQDATAMVKKIGYPVLIKTDDGGGGRGMCRADCAEELANIFDTAKTEIHANFGDDIVYMEKFIVEPKRAEMQLMADKHESVVHLYKRDCSYQRRNQKLLEEASCHILEKDMHEHLLRDAVCIVESIGYDSVGTIESLLDVRGEYYFAGMNTRVQVEHTIFEETYGIDLIKQQIRVMDDRKPTYGQENTVYHGHAVKYRINAENIKYNFAPSPGQVNFISFPLGCHVHIESVTYNDYNIPPYYDFTIAKVIICVDARPERTKRMCSALEELLVEGMKTNIEFQYLLLHHSVFVDSRYDTGFMGSFTKKLKGDRTII